MLLTCDDVLDIVRGTAILLSELVAFPREQGLGHPSSLVDMLEVLKT